MWRRGGWHGDVGVRWRKGGRVLGQRGEVGGRLCFGNGGTIGVLLGGVGTGLRCWGVGGGLWLQEAVEAVLACLTAWAPGPCPSISGGLRNANLCQNVSPRFFFVGLAPIAEDTICLLLPLPLSLFAGDKPRSRLESRCKVRRHDIYRADVSQRAPVFCYVQISLLL